MKILIEPHLGYKVTVTTTIVLEKISTLFPKIRPLKLCKITCILSISVYKKVNRSDFNTMSEVTLRRQKIQHQLYYKLVVFYLRLVIVRVLKSLSTRTSFKGKINPNWGLFLVQFKVVQANPFIIFYPPRRFVARS